VILRDANINDLSILKYWDKQPHIKAAIPGNNWQWELELSKKPSWREQLIVELESKPIGFIQIIDPSQEESHYWGEIGSQYRAIDIWIGDKNFLGKGYGQQMMKLAINRCFQQKNVTSILVDPLCKNHQARKFYEKIGFKFVNDRIFINNLCAVYEYQRE